MSNVIVSEKISLMAHLHVLRIAGLKCSAYHPSCYACQIFTHFTTIYYLLFHPLNNSHTSSHDLNEMFNPNTSSIDIKYCNVQIDINKLRFPVSYPTFYVVFISQEINATLCTLLNKGLVITVPILGTMFYCVTVRHRVMTQCNILLS